MGSEFYIFIINTVVSILFLFDTKYPKRPNVWQIVFFFWKNLLQKNNSNHIQLLNLAVQLSFKIKILVLLHRVHYPILRQEH